MKRFLLALALVAVAGATYVATAPGSHTSAGPTARQFKALKNEVTGLKKQLRHLKSLANAEGKLLTDCMAVSVPIDRFGDYTNDPATYGYMYSDPSINSGTEFPRSALDVTAPDDQYALWITGGTATCGADIGTARRKVAAQPFGAGRH